MKAKSIVAGALKPNSMKIQEDKLDAMPADGLVPIPKMYGKSAVTFGGTDEYLTGPNMFNVGTGDFTISTWVYIPDGAVVVPFAKYLDANNYFYAYINDGSGIVQTLAKVGGSTKDNYTVITSSITGDAWNHFTWTFDRSAGDAGIVMYINGGPVSLTFNVSDTATTDSLNFDSYTNVGRYTTNGSSFTYNGAGVKQADLRFYSKALSSGEVSTMHSESIVRGPNAAGLRSDLLHYFTFGDTKGDGLINRTGDIHEFFDLTSLGEPYQTNRENGQICVNPNADLSFSTGWSSGSALNQWAITDNAFRSGANLNLMTNSASVTIGGLYQLIHNMTLSGGSCSIIPYVGTTGSGTLDDANGKYTHYIRASKTTGLQFMSIVSSGQHVTTDSITLLRYDRGGLTSHNMEDSDFGRVKLSTDLF